jgi:hypothetical protein
MRRGRLRCCRKGPAVEELIWRRPSSRRIKAGTPYASLLKRLHDYSATALSLLPPSQYVDASSPLGGKGGKCSDGKEGKEVSLCAPAASRSLRWGLRGGTLPVIASNFEWVQSEKFLPNVSRGVEGRVDWRVAAAARGGGFLFRTHLDASLLDASSLESADAPSLPPTLPSLPQFSDETVADSVQAFKNATGYMSDRKSKKSALCDPGEQCAVCSVQ